MGESALLPMALGTSAASPSRDSDAWFPRESDDDRTSMVAMRIPAHYVRSRKGFLRPLRPVPAGDTRVDERSIRPTTRGLGLGTSPSAGGGGNPPHGGSPLGRLPDASKFVGRAPRRGFSVRPHRERLHQLNRNLLLSSNQGYRGARGGKWTSMARSPTLRQGR
jgi:hypothetical protein